MTIWRPSDRIRVKAIGLHWRDGRLLACEVHNDLGQINGVRPLGGTVEFGERWTDALVREFKEELGIDVTLTGQPRVIENLFTHEGTQGHEVIFVSDVVFPDDSFAGQDVIHFAEDNGVACTARWFDLATLDVPGGVSLYPTGLMQQLVQTAPAVGTT